MSTQANYIRWFNELTIDDVPLVGGKNASLGEMYRELTPQGIQIPNGFAVTAEAYRYLLEQAGAWQLLHQALDDLNQKMSLTLPDVRLKHVKLSMRHPSR